MLGVVINGEAKAYPHNIGWHHEIINDTIGGHPIIVTFCPLTGTGMVFDGRDEDGRRITTGVSGLLFNNNLIMYDRRDNASLYPQMISKGITGPQTNRELKLLPVIETTWRYWKQLYPNTRVVDGNNSSRNYTSYPYGFYRDPNSAPLFPLFPLPTDNPVIGIYSPKHLTLGVRFGEIAKAYPFPSLGEETVFNDTVANTPIVVIWYAREWVAVPYFRELGTRILSFEKVASTEPTFPFFLKDNETGTTWNLKGEAIAGELRGSRLNQVPAHNAFWFAWATFWQHTGIF